MAVAVAFRCKFISDYDMMLSVQCKMQCKSYSQCSAATKSQQAKEAYLLSLFIFVDGILKIIARDIYGYIKDQECQYVLIFKKQHWMIFFHWI